MDNKIEISTNNYKLNFLACAIKKEYEDFLIPFLFFSLYTNEDSHFEIVF